MCQELYEYTLCPRGIRVKKMWLCHGADSKPNLPCLVSIYFSSPSASKVA